MTPQEKDRLEIVNAVCMMQNCDLRAIYNFIKTGDQDVEPEEAHSRYAAPDGIYLIAKDGEAIPFDGHGGDWMSKENCVGVGIKQGDRSLIVALKDAADGEDVTLTAKEDKTDADGYYIDNYLDAVADWEGADNTDHLRAIGLNPAIVLENGQYIPSVGEMYLIYTHRKALNEALRFVGGQEIKGGWYWTSTEYSATNAWYLLLSSGSMGGSTKASNKCRVRPVSAFIS